MTAVASELESSGKFKGLDIVQNETSANDFIQMRIQFLQAVIDNLNSRFPTTELLEAGAVLNPLSWPVEDDQKVVFGDEQVLKLAKICHIDGRQAVDDFRQYKVNTRRIGETLEALLKRINIMPLFRRV